MLRQNQTSGCHPCQIPTAKNPQTPWTRKGLGAPPPARCREPIPESTPPPPGTPPAPTVNTSGAQPAETITLPARYTFSLTDLPFAEYFEDDKDTEYDTEFDPDLLSDEG